MSPWRQLSRGLRALVRRRQAEADLTDELDHYLEEAVAAHRARGLSPEDARRAARLELGSETGVAEQVRAYGWENVVSSAAADVRHGARRSRWRWASARRRPSSAPSTPSFSRPCRTRTPIAW